MNPILKLACLTLFILPSLISLSQNEIFQEEQLDNLLNDLWKTESSSKSKRMIRNICKMNPDYNVVAEKLRSGRNYSPNVKTGYVEWNYVIDSLNYTCIVLVPSHYSINQEYPVSFILHGAVMSLNPEAIKTYVKKNSYNYDSLDKIMIYPASWIQSPWWNEKQENNLNYLIHRLKQTYNIDEDNIHLAGISDGGTGAVYQANLNITPWASFRPYISNPGSLSLVIHTPIYLKNLGNRPFLFISSENDDLFPPQLIESFLSEMKKANCIYNYYLAKGYKHEISWLPIYKDTINHFIKNNERDPYPSKLFWQTNNPKYGRNHWVIIDKLYYEYELSENEYPVLKSEKNKNDSNSGIIDVHCTGNTITVNTINIKQYTLLLSPEQFDFEEEIQIYTNDKLSYIGKFEKNLDKLLKWYKKDLDRAMLFGNEITIKVK